MPELTDEQKALRDKLRKDAEEAEKIRAERGEFITNPGKYSGPIGLDDEGRPFRKSTTPDDESNKD